jgi:hypothetical protein
MMRRHVDAETLARFRQGDLSPRRNARIRAHLAGCERCRDLNEDLAGVTTLLASAQPPPIPEHLAARIQTALATEAARRVAVTAAAGSTAAGNTAAGSPAAGDTGTGTATTGAGGPGPEEQGLPQDGRSPRHERPGQGRRRPRLPGLSSPVALRIAGAAAAAVVIAVGAYEVTQHAGSSSSSPSAGSAAPGPRAAGPAGGARNSANAPSAAGPQLRYQHAGHQDSFTPIMTSTDFTPSHLRSQVSRELATAGSAQSQGVPNTRHSSAAAPSERPSTFGKISVLTLEGCVSRIAGGGVVLLVDVARYQNAQATVIVTEASPTSPEQVWVVGTACSGTQSDVLAHVTLPPGG